MRCHVRGVTITCCECGIVLGGADGGFRYFAVFPGNLQRPANGSPRKSWVADGPAAEITAKFPAVLSLFSADVATKYNAYEEGPKIEKGLAMTMGESRHVVDVIIKYAFCQCNKRALRLLY